MKKLMIAAASAAMIVGAEAAQEADFVGSAGVVYDVTLSLKTTKGASAKKGAKQTVNLGWNGFSTFWYQDAEMNGTNDVTDVENIHWSKDVVVPGTTVKWADLQGSKKLSGKTIPALDQNAIKKLSETEKIKLGEALAAIAPFYSAKSAGKWCDTYTYTPDGLCYRETGSLKLQGLYVGDCCTAGAFLGDLFTYRFGSMNSEKATKVEYVGEFVVGGFYLFDSNFRETKYIPVADSVSAFGTPLVFAAAGQGTFGKVSVNAAGTRYTTDTIKTLSGNVVGVLPNTDCEYCCSLPIDAVCFDVCYTLLWSDAIRYNGSTTDPVSAGTAAFGTFTVKVNQKETNYYSAGDPKSVALFNGL
jgi:hypothetical protein